MRACALGRCVRLGAVLACALALAAVRALGDVAVRVRAVGMAAVGALGDVAVRVRAVGMAAVLSAVAARVSPC